MFMSAQRKVAASCTLLNRRGVTRVRGGRGCMDRLKGTSRYVCDSFHLPAGGPTPPLGPLPHLSASGQQLLGLRPLVCGPAAAQDTGLLGLFDEPQSILQLSPDVIHHRNDPCVSQDALLRP